MQNTYSYHWAYCKDFLHTEVSCNYNRFGSKICDLCVRATVFQVVDPDYLRDCVNGTGLKLL